MEKEKRERLGMQKETCRYERRSPTIGRRYVQRKSPILYLESSSSMSYNQPVIKLYLKKKIPWLTYYIYCSRGAGGQAAAFDIKIEKLDLPPWQHHHHCTQAILTILTCPYNASAASNNNFQKKSFFLHKAPIISCEPDNTKTAGLKYNTETETVCAPNIPD